MRGNGLQSSIIVLIQLTSNRIKLGEYAVILVLVWPCLAFITAATNGLYYSCNWCSMLAIKLSQYI